MNKSIYERLENNWKKAKKHLETPEGIKEFSEGFFSIVGGKVPNKLTRIKFTKSVGRCNKESFKSFFDCMRKSEELAYSKAFDIALSEIPVEEIEGEK